MAMDIDPSSMLEISLQEGPDIDRRQNCSSGVMHQVENDVQVHHPPPPLHYYGSDILTPQRAVLNNIQKLSATSKDEEKFRRRAYSSISLVLRKRLHCTICDAHIGAYLGLKEMDIEHPLLKVLACSKCTLKYHYLEFPLNIDGRDVRCRWCTNSSKEDNPLRFCNYCPFAFCEMCIYRNLPLDELASNKSNWVCFVCNVKDLWPSRAVLWALRVLIDTNLALKEEKKWSTDQSTCCKNKVTKRRVVSLPQGGCQPTNGHNVAVRAVVPNQFRFTTQNNYLLPYNVAPPPPLAVRSVAMPQQTAYRAIRPIVQPVRPVNIPVAAAATNSPTTQLYDTSWLTDKVSNISTTLLNLNNNLHRLAQGIPEKENKYSIKSKMISMVSLLNISATQLQKASKEMEEESKRILDKNYRVARITPVAPVENKPEPVASTSRAGTSLAKRPPPRSRSTSSKRNKRRRRASRTDSDSDPDDPDFRTKAKIDGVSEEEFENDPSWSSTRAYQTRLCFVKLERLDEKYVANYKSGAESDSKSDAGSRSGEPKPLTSSAPEPSETVPASELADRRDADSGSGEAELKKEEAGNSDDHKPSELENDAAPSKESDGVSTSKETDDSVLIKNIDDVTISEKPDDVAPKTSDGVSTSKQTNGAVLIEKTDDVAISEETDDVAPKTSNGVSTSKQTDDAVFIEKTDDAAISEKTDDVIPSKKCDGVSTSKQTDDVVTGTAATSEETDNLLVSQNDGEPSEPAPSDELAAAPDRSRQDVEVSASSRNSSSEIELDPCLSSDMHQSSAVPGSEDKEPPLLVGCAVNPASDSSSADSSTTLDSSTTSDTSTETSKTDSTSETD